MKHHSLLEPAKHKIIIQGSAIWRENAVRNRLVETYNFLNENLPGDMM